MGPVASFFILVHVGLISYGRFALIGC